MEPKVYVFVFICALCDVLDDHHGAAHQLLLGALIIILYIPGKVIFENKFYDTLALRNRVCFYLFKNEFLYMSICCIVSIASI